MASGRVSLFAEHFGNLFGHFGKVHRRAVLAEHQEGVIADTAHVDIGRLSETPLAEGILANPLGERNPALGEFFNLWVFGHILQLE